MEPLTRAEPTPELAFAFREVGFDELGLVSDPHFHRARAFVVWVVNAELAGIFPIAAQGIADIDPALTLYIRLNQSASRRLFVDLRGFGLDNEVFQSMLNSDVARDSARRLLPIRASVVLPDDWTRAWWVGAVELGETIAAPTRAFSETAPAWQWLDVPHAISSAVEALQQRYVADAALRTDLSTLLRRDPSLGIEGAARALGLSLRSLQRALRQSGDTFAELRQRARAEVALTRLAQTDDKIDAVASSAGFRSRSHFVAWFRRLTGVTPAEYRQRSR